MNLWPPNTRITLFFLCVLVHNFWASKESKCPSSWPQAFIPLSNRNQSLIVYSSVKRALQPAVMVSCVPWASQSSLDLQVCWLGVLLVCGKSRAFPTDCTPTEHLPGLFMLWGGIFPSFPPLTVPLSDVKHFGVVNCCLRCGTVSLAIHLLPPLASCRCLQREHHQQCRNAGS